MEKRIWFITGISSGLGQALAAAVSETEDFVIGTFRQQKQAQAFVKAHGNRADAFVLDITDAEAVKATVKKIEEKYGRIDVLVNNAGVGFAGAVEETNDAEVRNVMEVNFFGVLHLTREVLPLMRRRRSGHIVQISSHGGLKAFAGFGIYNASKFALEGFSEALAQEIAPLGIKLSMVEPGPFRTNFAGGGLGLADKVIDDYADTAGAFRQKLKGVHQKQEGHPGKAAAAIIALVNAENPALRLPLGSIALKTIGMKIDSVRTDLENGRETAAGAVYNE